MAYQAEIEKLEARFREKPEQWFAALADAYRKAGDLDMALEVLGAWIDKRPNYTSGHIVLGRCYLDKEEDYQAAKAFESVLELDMENVIALKCLSEIAERQGDAAAARNWLERLLEVDPMNEEAQAALEAIGTEDGAEFRAEGAEGAEEIDQEPAEVLGFEPTAEPVDEEAAVRESVELDGRVEAVEAAEMSETSETGEAESVVEEAPLDVVGMVPMEEEEFPAHVAELESDAAADEAHGVLEDAVEDAVPFGLVDEELTETTLPEPIEAMHAPTEAEVEAEPEEPELPEPEPSEVPDTLERPVIPEGLIAEVEEGRAIAPTVAEFEPIRIEPKAEPPEEPAAELEIEEVDEEPAAPAPAESRLSIGMPEMYVYESGGDDSALPSVGQAEERDAILEPFVDLDAGSAAVEFVEQPPGDLDATLVEESVAQPEPEPESPLELIVPEGAESGEPEPDVAETEPIVTETMAELYAGQGLIEEAKDIYRRLLSDRPGDPHLEARLADLEEAEAGVVSEPARVESFLASATGGESVRAVMDALLGTAEQTETPIEKTEEVPAIDIETSGIETSEDESGRVETSSASTTPSDGGRSFSFDDFFGGGGEQPKPEEPPASPPAQGPENEEFKDWLKGLKT